MVAVLRLWRARWRIPFYSDGDATLTAAWIKTVLVRGWYFDNPKLGFPTGANARDYPTGDLWHLVLLRVFALGSHNWALAMNVTFVGTFLLITATAYIQMDQIAQAHSLLQEQSKKLNPSDSYWFPRLSLLALTQSGLR